MQMRVKGEWTPARRLTPGELISLCALLFAILSAVVTGLIWNERRMSTVESGLKVLAQTTGALNRKVSYLIRKFDDVPLLGKGETYDDHEITWAEEQQSGEHP